MRSMQSSTPKHLTSNVERILRIAEVKARTGLSRSTIYEMISRREFPSSFSIGARAVGWLESEVAGFINARAAARRSV